MSAQEAPFITNKEYRSLIEGDLIRPDDRVGTNYAVFMVQQPNGPLYEIFVTKPDKSRVKFHESSKAAEYVNVSHIAFKKMLWENGHSEFLVRLNDLKTFYFPSHMSPGDILEFGIGTDSVTAWNISKDRSEFFYTIEEAEISLGIYKGWFQEQKKTFKRVFMITPSKKLEPYDGRPTIGVTRVSFESDVEIQVENVPPIFTKDPRRLVNGVPNQRQVFCRPDQ